METRIKINEKELNEVYSSLQEEGYTIREISDRIGTNFRNALYKGSSFTEESFRELRKLYGNSIPHTRGNYIDGRGFKKKLDLTYSSELAELVGLILGDGHLRKESYESDGRYISNHYLDICFNRKEKTLIDDAKGLIESLLGKKPSIKDFSDSQAVSLRAHGKEIVESLESVGLESGDKVENQIKIPNWIYRNKEFEFACLRGLIDSDGSIYEREDGYKVVYFKNHSDNLLEDFRKLCSDLGISSSRAGPNAVQVASQRDVEKFLEKVNPRKCINP